MTVPVFVATPGIAVRSALDRPQAAHIRTIRLIVGIGHTRKLGFFALAGLVVIPADASAD